MTDDFTPPGNTPLYDGLGAEWNDIVGAFPEDKRGELAPKLKERIDNYSSLEPWRDFQKSGITPEQATQALDIYKTIESNPRYVYDAIARHLGISNQEAKEVVQQVEQASEEDPTNAEIARLKQQIETMSQIMIAENQQRNQSREQEAADQKLESDLAGLKKKYGDFDEQQIVMRMLHLDMTPEQAYQDYNGMVSQIRQTRPSPSLLGAGGTAPRQGLDVTKLERPDTRKLVAQMLENSRDRG